MIRQYLTRPTRFDEQVLIQISAVVLAIIGGFFVVTQPLEMSILLIGGVGMLVASLISPIVPLIALLIIAPLRSLVATEATLQLPLDPGQLMVVYVIGMWVMYRISVHSDPLRLKWTHFYVPVGIFIMATAFTLTTAASVSVWATEWLKWVLIAGLMVLIVSTPVSRQWEWLAFGLVCAGVANAIVGIYIFLGGSGADHLLILDRFYRAFGTFGQPNPFGGFMGILAPIALMMSYGYLQVAVSQWFRSRRISVSATLWLGFYSGAALLIIAGIFISWSRGAWLGFGISALFLLAATPRRLSIAVSVLAMASITGGLIWSSGFLPTSITDRVSSATQEAFELTDVRAVDITSANFAIIERLAHWQAAYNMAESNFWLGIGFGNYEIVYSEYQLINWDEPLGHAHNYYLNIFGEAGFIGLSAYLVMIAGILWLIWQTKRHPDPVAHALSIGIMGSWVYLLAHSLTDNLYVNNIFMHLGIMLGIVSVLHKEVQAIKVANT